MACSSVEGASTLSEARVVGLYQYIYCVLLLPERDDVFNVPGATSTETGVICELRHNGVLRSSFSHLTQSLQEVVHLGDAPSRLLMLACFQWGCATTSQSAPSRSREEQRQEDPVTTETTIRPFRVDVPEEDLVELRRRIAATRWPERETVDDSSQGVRLATIRELARYWGTDYDLRRFEARLNALPQFKTEIDGVDIHFIHVRSPHENALPLIMTHGWPGSVVELLETVGPLTDPTAHGGRAEDAFDLVLPSVPGYGFSEEPRETGWDPGRVARLGGADAPPRLHPLCRPGRRRGRRRHRRDGTAGARGAARHPHQLARDGAGRPPAGGIRAGTRGRRHARHIQGERLRLLPGDGHAAADDRLRPA